MASKSVLKMTAIQNYFGDYAVKAVTRGENALESGHLLSISYDSEMNSILATVHASQKKTSYTVMIDFTRTDIKNASCTCVRGLGGCHHMATVMLHAHRHLSVTDTSCSWSARKTTNEEDVTSIDDLYKKKVKKTGGAKSGKDAKAEYVPVTGVNITDEELAEIAEKIDLCDGAAIHFKWLTSKEPEKKDLEDETDEAITVIQPRDVIFTEEYLNAHCKISFLTEYLGLGWENILEIADATKLQSANPLWIALREWRITASNFGEALLAFQKAVPKPRPSFLKKLYEQRSLKGIKAVQWGINHESDAIKYFSEKYSLEVNQTGLWLHECGFLGGSPDGLVGQDAIVEVKCPFKYRNEKLKNILSKDFTYFAKYVNGEWYIDQTHEYYHQIQGNLYFTKREYCYFVMYTTKGIEDFVIPIDNDWEENIYLLQRFYCEFLVPYIQKNCNF